MGPRHPFILVPSHISHDTVEALTELCEHAKRQHDPLIGLAYVAMYRGRRYIADATGEAYRNPSWSRGLLLSLDDKLAQMVGSRK